MKRRWLYKDDDAKIFYDGNIEDAIRDGWTKRPSDTIVAAEDIDTLDTKTLREKARLLGIENYATIQRKTLIKKLKELK